MSCASKNCSSIVPATCECLRCTSSSGVKSPPSMRQTDSAPLRLNEAAFFPGNNQAIFHQGCSISHWSFSAFVVDFSLHHVGVNSGVYFLKSQESLMGVSRLLAGQVYYIIHIPFLGGMFDPMPLVTSLAVTLMVTCQWYIHS